MFAADKVVNIEAFNEYIARNSKYMKIPYRYIITYLVNMNKYQVFFR